MTVAVMAMADLGLESSDSDSGDGGADGRSGLLVGREKEEGVWKREGNEKKEYGCLHYVRRKTPTFFVFSIFTMFWLKRAKTVFLCFSFPLQNFVLFSKIHFENNKENMFSLF